MIIRPDKRKEASSEFEPKLLLVTAIAVLIIMVSVYLVGAQFRDADGESGADKSVEDGVSADDGADDNSQSDHPNETDRDFEGTEPENTEIGTDTYYDDTFTDTESVTETESETELITETEPATETETETETEPETEKVTEPPETDPPETKPKPETTDPPVTKPKPETTETKPPVTEPKPTDPPVTEPDPTDHPAEQIAIYVEGMPCAFSAVYRGDTVYGPVGDIAVIIDWNSQLSMSDNGETCHVTGDGIEIRASVGDPFVLANDRAIPCKDIYAEGGRVMAPISVIAKIFGAEMEAAVDGIYLGRAKSYIKNADSFYDEDQLYLLSRLIDSEARNESFDGKLAVGAVVMNRIRSSEFPNTMYDVLFEKNQFSTVDNDSFYRNPTKDSVYAAKMCLEGYLYDRRVLFFDSTFESWASRNREFLFKLGDHYFYG